MSKPKRTIPQQIAAYMAVAPLDEARVVLDVARAVLEARSQQYDAATPRPTRVRKPKHVDEPAA